MTSTTINRPEFQAKLDEINAFSKSRFRWTLAMFGLIFIYFTLSFIQFDLGSIARKWDPERASRFILDTYAHKDHVTLRWNKPGEFRIAFEGGYREVY